MIVHLHAIHANADIRIETNNPQQLNGMRVVSIHKLKLIWILQNFKFTVHIAIAFLDFDSSKIQT